MSAVILDGKALGLRIEAHLAERVAALKNSGVEPHLAVVLAGNDPASQVYVRNKQRACERCGIKSTRIDLPNDVSQEQLMRVVANLNSDESVHGILVQSPTPNGTDELAITETIDPSKDVDGFTPNNVGKLFLGEDTLVSCTPKGIMQMLRISGTDLSGKNVTVIGRSNIVGKPVSILCQSENATVTMCHSRTKDLNHKLSDADVIIVAVGVPKFISGDQIPEGAVVIDVGIHNIDGKLYGDVDFESAKEKASAITPVPGGVGPMTVCAPVSYTHLTLPTNREV